MYQPISIVNIYYQGFGDKRLIGKLTMDGRRPTFGYDAAWLADGLELSPIEMPLRSAPYYGAHASSHYLCGLLSDSLPDGWGMLLMDRFFRKTMPNAGPINVLDRLTYIVEALQSRYSTADAIFSCLLCICTLEAAKNLHQ